MVEYENGAQREESSCAAFSPWRAVAAASGFGVVVP